MVALIRKLCELNNLLFFCCSLICIIVLFAICSIEIINQHIIYLSHVKASLDSHRLRLQPAFALNLILELHLCKCSFIPTLAETYESCPKQKKVHKNAVKFVVIILYFYFVLIFFFFLEFFFFLVFSWFHDSRNVANRTNVPLHFYQLIRLSGSFKYALISFIAITIVAATWQPWRVE